MERDCVSREVPGRPLSPCDRSLLGGVDVLFATGLEEKRLHVLRQEAPRLGVHRVQTVVIDEHHLLASPLAPTVLTDLSLHTRTDRPGKWRALESGSRLTTPTACHVWHKALVLAPGENYLAAHAAPRAKKKSRPRLRPAN